VVFKKKENINLKIVEIIFQIVEILETSPPKTTPFWLEKLLNR
jgi:hypothetical protein